MKKKNILFAALVATALIFSGCVKAKVETATTEGAETKAAGETLSITNFITAESDNPDKIVLRYASTSRNLDDHPYMRGFKKFFEVLKTELGDKVEIQYYLGGTLGTSTDAILGGLQNESFEMTDWPLGSFAELTNAFQPFDVPYLFTSMDNAMDLLGGEVGDIMTEKCLEDTNLRPLYYAPIGMRQLTNSKNAVKTPDDMKGLKIRVQNNPLHIAGMKALGCSPTPISFGELFTSLQQKVVDGQENPLSTIYDYKFAEVQKYLTITNHLSAVGTMAVNEDYYQSLPSDVKAAFDKASAAAAAFTLNEVKNAEAEYLLKLKGILEVYEPSEAELKVFQEKAMTAWPEMEESIGVEYFGSIITAAGLK